MPVIKMHRRKYKSTHTTFEDPSQSDSFSVGAKDGFLILSEIAEKAQVSILSVVEAALAIQTSFYVEFTPCARHNRIDLKDGNPDESFAWIGAREVLKFYNGKKKGIPLSELHLEMKSNSMKECLEHCGKYFNVSYETFSVPPKDGKEITSRVKKKKENLLQRQKSRERRSLLDYCIRFYRLAPKEDKKKFFKKSGQPNISNFYSYLQDCWGEIRKKHPALPRHLPHKNHFISKYGPNLRKVMGSAN